jgi:hypothetical protein
MKNHTESPLIRKIRALRAKAEGKGVTEAEAAAFAAKVQELLAANGLSMADVGDAEHAPEAIAGQEFPDVASPARQVLLRATCRYYMCEAIGPARRGMNWTIVGKPSNVLVALEMFDYLIKTVVRLSNEYGRQSPTHNKIDFRRGAMTRLAERLMEEWRKATEAKPEWRSHGNPGNLPALFVNEQQQIRAYVAQRMNTRTSAGPRIKHGNDAAVGRQAANGISLHRQVGGGGGRLMIGGK